MPPLFFTLKNIGVAHIQTGGKFAFLTTAKNCICIYIISGKSERCIYNGKFTSIYKRF